MARKALSHCRSSNSSWMCVFATLWILYKLSRATRPYWKGFLIDLQRSNTEWGFLILQFSTLCIVEKCLERKNCWRFLQTLKVSSMTLGPRPAHTHTHTHTTCTHTHTHTHTHTRAHTHSTRTHTHIHTTHAREQYRSGYGTMLQTGRSRVQFPMKFFICKLYRCIQKMV
jgi:hypothetical protein